MARVFAPVLAGVLMARVLAKLRTSDSPARARPGEISGRSVNWKNGPLQMVGSGVLLTLCYANAAVALPHIVQQPDWDYLAVMLVIVAVMCVVGFAAGAVIGRSARADRPQRASLMFGLGMTNNGTGLVIAAGALAHIPEVMLPVIFYNLIQHVVAGCVDHYWLGGDIGPPNQPLRLTGEA